MGFISYAKKYKAFSLVGSYIRNHMLLYSIFQLLLLRKDKTGLELFRNCMEKKLYDKLKHKNKKLINSHVAEAFTNAPAPKIIWLCWFQGFEKAPELVRKCKDSVYRYCTEYRIVELTTENILQYVSIPENIMEKWKTGRITNTHFSDILRIYILSQNGGVWIDSTVLLTGELPEDIQNSSFFVFQKLKPGRDGSAIFVSSWFMQSCKNHPIIELIKELLENYWEKNNTLCDYFLIHYFICFACEKYSELYEQIPKYTNSTPHILFFNLFKQFDWKKYNAICKQTVIHKLSYKGIDSNKIKNSFYEYILEAN